MTPCAISPILCLGITPCLQRTLFFDLLRTGEVNRATRVIETASGKGTNVARVIQALGGASRLVGICGGETGKRFETLLQKERFSYWLVRSRYPTRMCQTLIDEATGQTTELVEEAATLDADEIKRLQEQLAEGLTPGQWLVISGSPPPKTAPTLYRDLIEQAQALGASVLLDTQKEPLLKALPATPWMVKLNQQELAVTLKRDIRTPSETKASASILLEQGACNVVITHGPHQVWWISREGVHTLIPPQVRPVNPIGSGDAMTAGIVLGVSRGESIEESLRLGIACGAANALTLTSGVVQPHSVQGLLSQVSEAEAG